MELVFFMAIVAVTFHRSSFPDGAKFPSLVVLGLGAACIVVFLGGKAAAEGKVPIPGAQDNPIKFGLTSGAAALVVVLIIGRLLW